MTLLEWIEVWKKQYSARELNFLKIQKALIQLQLRDPETEEIHIQNSEFKAKDALDLKINVLESNNL